MYNRHPDGEGNGTPLQYSCLENPMDGGAWWAAVHGVAKSRAQLSEHLHFHFSLSCTREGDSNLLQCSCLENPRDGGAWWAAVYGVTQSRTRLKRLSSSSSSSSSSRHPEKSTNHRYLALGIFHEMSLSVCTDQELKEPQNIDTSAPIFLQLWPSPTILTSNIRNYFCGTFLGIQLLRVYASTMGEVGLIPGLGSLNTAKKENTTY